ncbi:MAG: hypothetical protein ABNH00_00460 [Dokdonia sp.]|jgi:hypothetical protein|nr:hypothetical protein [Cytophagaceae bacterium]
MKKRLFGILTTALVLSIGCTEGDKAIEEVLVEVDRGAVLRTLQINNAEFDINDTAAVVDIDLEEQDIEEGDLLESVSISVRFVDNTPENGDNTSNTVQAMALTQGDFEPGANGLPITKLQFSFAELLNLTTVAYESVSCKDQFRIDLALALTDGRVFTTSNSSGTVVNNTGFFKSPFSYVINIVEPIEETAFTGTYRLSIEEEGFFGPTFNDGQLVTLTQGHSNNVRVFEARLNSETVPFEFSVVCDAAVVTRYQKSGFGCSSDFSDRVLLGPDREPGLTNQNDDAVLELKFVEAFEGYDAFCNMPEVPVVIRLSKQ